MILSVVSDVTLQALIAAVVTIALAYLQHRIKVTSDKIDDLKVVTSSTHTLVNSNMGVQLTLVADLSREKSNRTGLPADIAAAELAERMLEEHRTKQDIVDARAE